MNAAKPVQQLHQEHMDWLKRLDFYIDEIAIMKPLIEDVAAKNTSPEILAQVEHFQNQIIIQKNHVDELRHDINDHESFLEKRADKEPFAHDHPVLRDRMMTFETLFHQLRKELYVFLAKVL